MSSREYKGKKIVVWSAYIDLTLSRSRGRKIARKHCVKKPRIEEIIKVAEKLGLNPIVEEAKYPRLWSEYQKRVLVDKRDSKIKTLIMIAEEVKKIRQAKHVKQG